MVGSVVIGQTILIIKLAGSTWYAVSSISAVLRCLDHGWQLKLLVV